MAGLLLSLRDDVMMDEPRPGEVRLRIPGLPIAMLAFRQITPGLKHVFARLCSDLGGSEDDLTALVMDVEGPEALVKLKHFLKKMDEARMLCRSLSIDGVVTARLVPTSDTFTFNPEPPAGSVRLSRLAVLHREGKHLVIESPGASARLEVLDESTMVAIYALVSPCEALPLTKIVGCTLDDCRALLTLLANAGTLTAVTEAGEAEDLDPAATTH